MAFSVKAIFRVPLSIPAFVTCSLGRQFSRSRLVFFQENHVAESHGVEKYRHRFMVAIS